MAQSLDPSQGHPLPGLILANQQSAVTGGGYILILLPMFGNGQGFDLGRAICWRASLAKWVMPRQVSADEGRNQSEVFSAGIALWFTWNPAV